jgi:acyl-CoA dehydrogenase
LIVKFMANYFFNSASYPEIKTCHDPVNDDFLFNQGATKGLGKIRFHDFQLAFDTFDLPNTNLFNEQIAIFKEFLLSATPNEAQTQDIDFLLALGEIFTLVVYAQLILENAKIYNITEDLVDQIFDFMVRDFSKYALGIYSKPGSSQMQMDYCLKMIRKPIVNPARYLSIWSEHVLPLKGAYTMSA